MRVSVSIVSYDSAGHIGACLDSVRAQGRVVGEVLVSDNGSRDGTVARIRSDHPDVRVDSIGRNLGYAVGHNRNISRARGEFVLVLNPDVRLDPGYVATLADRLSADADLGAAIGQLVTPGPSPLIDSAGIAYDAARTRFIDRGRGRPPSEFGSERDVFGACGAAALFRRSALERVFRAGERPFAERFFMYYEDVDLAWRLRRSGWRARYCPAARATHTRGGSAASAAFIEYHLVRNRTWVSVRNASVGEFVRELPGLAVFHGIKLLQSVRRPHLRAALRDQLLGIPRSFAERRLSRAEG